MNEHLGKGRFAMADYFLLCDQVAVQTEKQAEKRIKASIELLKAMPVGWQDRICFDQKVDWLRHEVQSLLLSHGGLSRDVKSDIKSGAARSFVYVMKVAGCDATILRELYFDRKRLSQLFVQPLVVQTTRMILFDSVTPENFVYDTADGMYKKGHGSAVCGEGLAYAAEKQIVGVGSSALFPFGYANLGNSMGGGGGPNLDRSRGGTMPIT